MAVTAICLTFAAGGDMWVYYNSQIFLAKENKRCYDLETENADTKNGRTIYNWRKESWESLIANH